MNLWEDFLKNDFTEKAAKDINKMIDEELKKPKHEIDYHKIQELTNILPQIYRKEEILPSESIFTEELLMALTLLELEESEQTEELNLPVKETPKDTTKETYKPRRRGFNLRKGFIIVTAVICFTVSLMSRCFISTTASDNKEGLPYALHFDKNGFFSLSYPEELLTPYEAPDVDLSEVDDPFGMIAESAKYGMNSETPHYIPDGYTLEDIKYFYDFDGNQNLYFDFIYENDPSINIHFNYYLYANTELIPYHMFNGNKRKISNIKINGTPAVRLEQKKEGWYTVIYHIGSLMICISTYNLPEGEFDKIIASMK